MVDWYLIEGAGMVPGSEQARTGMDHLLTQSRQWEVHNRPSIAPRELKNFTL
jgi:hypothetical protein